jgi:RND family efflux transporter MFP subunit
MKRSSGIAWMLAAAVAGMGLTYGFIGSRAAKAGPRPLKPAAAAVAPLIATAHPQMRPFSQDVPWIGDVESRASVALTAPVAGRVVRITAGDQDRIEKGRPVMRLGGPRIDAQRAVLGAEIKSLASRLRLARQRVERVERSLKARLATGDQAAQARDTQIRLEVRLRQARLSLKTLDDQIRIPAPLSGTFTRRRVSPGQDVTAGQVIGEIIDTGRLRIAAAIFPPPGAVLQDRQVLIQLGRDRVLTGRVRQVLPRTTASGAVQIWIQGPQIDGQLRPGQTVSGTLAIQTESDALAVPRSAIVYGDGEHPYLFIRKDGAYERLGIQTGQEQGGWVEILSGLKQDQFVVVRGAYELFYRKFDEQFKVQD